MANCCAITVRQERCDDKPVTGANSLTSKWIDSVAMTSTARTELSLALCERVGAWRFEDLPAQVVRTLKLSLIDALAVIGGAAHAPGISELNARLARWTSGGSAVGLIGSRHYSPPSAALANGTAAHALDFDDVHDAARVHTMCVVLPAVLATAQDVGKLSGTDLILALAVGAELHARLGLTCRTCLQTGWHPTTMLGAMAASIAAGTLLGLEPVRLRDALGLAFHQASGSAQSVYDGVLAKRLGPGLAASAAVVAAFLAADGFTGPHEPLAAKAGLFALYARDEVEPEVLTDRLGDRWRIEEYSLKPYPGCRCSHAAIGIGIALHQQGIRSADVRNVEIRMSRANWTLVGAPYDAGKNSIVHAQFNASYSFARALLAGRVGLSDYEIPAITDPTVVELTKKIRVIADPAIEPTAMEPAVVTLTLDDGRTTSAETRTIKGGPQEPMTEEEIMAKLRDCLAFGLGATPEASNRIGEITLDLERRPDAVTRLCEAFAAAERSGTP